MDGDLVHLHKLLGELQFHFCVNISSQLQKAYVLTCWNLLCQKLQRLLVVEWFSRQLQRVWEVRLWENSCVVVAGKGVRAEPFQQKLRNKTVCRGETFLQTFLINHVEYFSVPTFCGSFWNSWGKSPVVNDVLLSQNKKSILLPPSMKTA